MVLQSDLYRFDYSLSSNDDPIEAKRDLPDPSSEPVRD